MKIKNIAIWLPVKDIKKSAEWYRKIFNPSKELDSSEEMQMIELKIGEIWIQLFVWETIKCENTLNFWVENLEKEFDRLKEMWIISDEKIEEIPDFIKYLEISDIDGNKIILSFKLKIYEKTFSCFKFCWL